LEARLNATTPGIGPFVAGQDPRRHFLRAMGAFQEAGLQDIMVRTFAGGAHAPLADGLRSALTALIAMRWSGAEAELAPADRDEYRRLCLPDSPDFVVGLPDYYAFFTYSMFQGRVAAGLAPTCPGSGRRGPAAPLELQR
jgi:demethylmenaquinone methyltransferase/2-methoxy-6-polyprenyl-1,4-benzoquinol methylase